MRQGLCGGSYSPSIEIGDNTSFEQNAHITSAGMLKIGKNCSFIADVLITNIDHDYSDLNEPVSKQKLIINETVIGDNCFIGMRASIFPGVHIGDNVIVGANAIVTHNIPSYCVVAGTPAKIIKRYDFDKKKWINTADEKRID